MNLKRFAWLALTISLYLFATAIASAQPYTVEGDWIVYETPRFFIFLSKDTPQERLGEGSDPLLTKLEEIAASLERNLGLIELVLFKPYSALKYGKVAVFVYASLEQYQQETGCLTCAAHVTSVPPQYEHRVLDGTLNPYAVYISLDYVPTGLGGLSIGLPQQVVPHELTHILDLTLIGGSKPTVLREGLAAYAAFKVDGISDAKQFGLTNQQLKLFMKNYEADLLKNLSLCGLRRFTYNFGASFIDFLIWKSGIGTFLSFFEKIMFRPSGGFCFAPEELDRLLHQHYGQSLEEIDKEYRTMLESLEITDEGLASFEYTMDQIFTRASYLSPLLKDGQSIVKAAREVWIDGGFNREKARFVREYLKNPENYEATRERVELAFKNTERLRAYVSNYYDARVRAQLETQLAQLNRLYLEGRDEEFRDLFVSLVQQYVTWKWS